MNADALQDHLMSLSRRRFFQGAAATGLTGMLGSTALAFALPRSPTLPGSAGAVSAARRSSPA